MSTASDFLRNIQASPALAAALSSMYGRGKWPADWPSRTTVVAAANGVPILHFGFDTGRSYTHAMISHAAARATGMPDRFRRARFVSRDAFLGMTDSTATQLAVAFGMIAYAEAMGRPALAPNAGRIAEVVGSLVISEQRNGAPGNNWTGLMFYGPVGPSDTWTTLARPVMLHRTGVTALLIDAGRTYATAMDHVSAVLDHLGRANWGPAAYTRTMNSVFNGWKGHPGAGVDYAREYAGTMLAIRQALLPSNHVKE